MVANMAKGRKSIPLSDVWGFLPVFSEVSFEIKKDMRMLDKLSLQYRWDLQRDLNAELIKGNVIVVTTPDKVFTFASHYFEKMTGYTVKEAIGRKPDFLQGKDTAVEDKELIREALFHRLPVKAEIINYRKNGETYLCSVEILPIYNTSKKLVHFLAIEKEV